MIEMLLDYSLERIASLQHFYNIESENILRVSQGGQRKNGFGFLVDRFLSAVSLGEESEEVSSIKESLSEYIDIIEVNSEKRAVSYRLKQKDILIRRGCELDIKKAAVMYRKFADMPIIHGNNTLIMLIARFEEFMSNLLSEIYDRFPQKYLDNQTITYSELSSLNISDVKKAIVSRQIDATMRASYKEWFKTLESHKLSFDLFKDELKILEEVYARRNIIVHNSGCVNQTYLDAVPNTTEKIGNILKVDCDYLAQAFNAINILIFGIMIESAKLIADNRDEYLQHIFDDVFDRLSNKEYVLCCKVYQALMGNKYLDNMYKTMSRVNYWISMIETRGTESVREEIESFDVSALTLVFSLAKCVLLEKYDDAKSLVERLYASKEINSSALESWPLFERFRSTEQYADIKKVHAEDFKVETFEVSSESGRDGVSEASEISPQEMVETCKDDAPIEDVSTTEMVLVS